MDRLVDYLYVAVVIAALWGLFRLARAITGRYLQRLEAARSRAGRALSRDEVLSRGFTVLLAGLIAMPLVTAAISVFAGRRLPGGIYLHLLMVALSVVIFSVVEDLFRLYKSYPSGPGWSVSRHLRRAGPLILAFWATGCLFLSPLFYSGLSLLLLLFYLFALWCRGDGEDRAAEDSR